MTHTFLIQRMLTSNKYLHMFRPDQIGVLVVRGATQSKKRGSYNALYALPESA